VCGLKLDDKHSLALVKEAVLRNKHVGNYRCAARWLNLGCGSGCCRSCEVCLLKQAVLRSMCFGNCLQAQVLPPMSLSLAPEWGLPLLVEWSM
jgi:hypothetical protein